MTQFRFQGITPTPATETRRSPSHCGDLENILGIAVTRGGDHADGSIADWHEHDFSLAEVRWLRLDIEKVVAKGNWVEKPDLSRVDEIGFTDLMPGSGHGPGGWSDVAWIEVYGKAVKRDAAGPSAQ